MTRTVSIKVTGDSWPILYNTDLHRGESWIRLVKEVPWCWHTAEWCWHRKSDRWVWRYQGSIKYGAIYIDLAWGLYGGSLGVLLCSFSSGCSGPGVVWWRTLTMWSTVMTLYMLSPPWGYLGGQQPEEDMPAPGGQALICHPLWPPQTHAPLICLHLQMVWRGEVQGSALRWVKVWGQREDDHCNTHYDNSQFYNFNCVLIWRRLFWSLRNGLIYKLKLTILIRERVSLCFAHTFHNSLSSFSNSMNPRSKYRALEFHLITAVGYNLKDKILDR